MTVWRRHFRVGLTASSSDKTDGISDRTGYSVDCLITRWQGRGVRVTLAWWWMPLGRLPVRSLRRRLDSRPLLSRIDKHWRSACLTSSMDPGVPPSGGRPTRLGATPVIFHPLKRQSPAEFMGGRVQNHQDRKHEKPTDTIKTGVIHPRHPDKHEATVPVLDQRWANVSDVGPALIQYRDAVSLCWSVSAILAWPVSQWEALFTRELFFSPDR